MKKALLSLLLIPASFCMSNAQGINDVLNTIKSKSGISTSQSNSPTKSPTPSTLIGNEEAVNGLREALQLGAKTATQNLSATNGFFGNAAIKVLMPPEVRTIEAKMRQFGFGKLMDNVILSMNRAAEDAAGHALPILANTIKTFTIFDGIEILNGGEDAATRLMQKKTTPELTSTFRPVIAASMSKYNVDQLWNQVFTNYNSLPIIKNKVNTDLTGYITERALNGLFTTIAQQEKKIRKDPVATGSALITRVFGSIKQ